MNTEKANDKVKIIPVDGGALLGDGHLLENIGQVAKGLVNVDNYTKGPSKNHLDVNWDKKSGMILSFYFGSDNESSVKAMALATKTPVTYNKDMKVWETSDF